MLVECERGRSSTDVDRGDVAKVYRADDVDLATVGIGNEVGVGPRVEHDLLRGRDDCLPLRDRRQWRRLLRALRTLRSRLSAGLLNPSNRDRHDQGDCHGGANGDSPHEAATESGAASASTTSEGEDGLVDSMRRLRAWEGCQGHIERTPGPRRSATSGACRDMGVGDELFVDGQLAVVLGR